MTKIKAIFFDLDGTLLPLDTDAFIEEYFRLLARNLGHLIPPAELAQHVMGSTFAMIANVDPEVSNEQAFFADFLPRVKHGPEVLWPEFNRFYAEQFPKLRERCLRGDPAPGRQAVETARELGYELVLATNPIFPRVAIEERMRWAGVPDFPWKLITTFEEMHFCKPQPGYYREVLAKTGYAPGECLMVGNDVQEDGVAAKLGIQTYIVTDFLINRQDGPVPEPAGTMAEFIQWLKTTQP